MGKIIKTINIKGMQCNHCKMTVEKALNGLSGVISVEVDLENNKAIVELEKEISDEEIKDVITVAGFQVIEIM